ncbi:MAG: hypothetical protein K2Y32_21200 [Candidatus Obscuribacterales bacterium]|nr:hypothetical protein [Candidatus Obscuribacterales bacterium]
MSSTFQLLKSEDLKERLSQGLCPLVLDTRPFEIFAKGSLPRAINLLWEDTCCKPQIKVAPVLHTPGYWGNLDEKTLEKLAKTIGAFAGNEDEIVVVGSGHRDKGREGRIAWTLAYMGAERVSLLDGPVETLLGAWEDSSGAIPVVHQEVQESKFKLTLNEKRRIKMPELINLLQTQAQAINLVDTRSLPEFNGDSYDYQPRKGHIPGAILFPYDDMFSGPEKLSYISKNQFLSKIAAAADKPTISYCEVGVRAALYAVLHEIYQGEIVRVYDGSIMEWGAHGEPVMECGAQ